MMEPATHNVKVIIAEDHHIFADGVEQILLDIPGFEVIAKVDNGKLLLQKLNSLSPDLLLLDINMPYMDGIEAAKTIRTRYPAIKIILLSMYYDATIIAFARQHQVNGYLPKSIMAPDLKKALLDVVDGRQTFIIPDTPSPASLDTRDSFSKKFKLSSRELEIINLIKKGQSTKQISDHLNLSAYTVETHRKNIFRKLQVKNMAELVALVTANTL